LANEKNVKKRNYQTQLFPDFMLCFNPIIGLLIYDDYGVSIDEVFERKTDSLP
jgi:hypothetical protein